MAFDRTTKRVSVPADPEALYRKLAPTNKGPDSLDQGRRCRCCPCQRPAETAYL